MKFLVERQSDDGAWRSAVYGPFKEGDALTPVVLMALLEAPDLQRHRQAIDKGTRFLATMVPEDPSAHSQRPPLAYPVYAAAAAVIDLSRHHDADPSVRDAWLKYLRGRQLVKPMGWQPEDPQYGGWGYSAEPVRKPAPGEALASLAEPNLSATVFALTALRAAGVAADAPEVRDALVFVRRCQNIAGDEAVADATFDDGGFFFMHGDPVRNKAGVTGTDRWGRERFASYGSTTADGLRALALCGLSRDDPRVVAAWKWLERHFSADTHPGAYVKQREGARAAPYFYYCHSLAAALVEVPTTVGANSSSTDANKVRWSRAIVDALLLRQRPDGSWVNAAVDLREDDPLVATSLAARALALCRAIDSN